MAVLADTRTGPIIQADGAGDQPLRQGRMGSLIVTAGHGRYFESTSRKNVFSAWSSLGAAGLIAFSTVTAIGGPLLWNGSTDVNCYIIGVGWSVTTAFTTTNLTLGLTGNNGQTSAPTSTTAADARGNCFVGGAASKATPYRLGTVANAGAFFLPVGSVHLGAVNIETILPSWVELASALVVPPNSWCSLAASAASTAGIINLGMVWEEVPI